jgi:hypothetical protein
MGRDDAYADDIDWLDVDSADATGATRPPRRPWPRWLIVVIAVAAVALMVRVLNIEHRDPSAARPGPPASSSQPAPSRAASSARLPPQLSTVVPVQPQQAPSVTRLGHPLLRTTAGWELFGRGPGVLVRIEPAAGRITETPLPPLQSSGPVSLLAGSDRVIVRPLDNVPGLVVPDGRPAAQLPQLLNVAGPVFPGPSPDQLWVEPADDHQPVMALVSASGRRLADVVPIPDGSGSMEAVADGAGYLLYPGIGGLYDARPDGVRRISTGVLVAVGPTGWLTIECDEHYRCATVLIGRVDGLRRTVLDGVVSRDWGGVISPDGSTAAVVTTGPTGAPGLALVDIAHHRLLRIRGVALTQETMTGAMVFSPDSRWLIVVTADGTVSVVDARTAAVRPLGISLPTLNQLVVRPASRARPSHHARAADTARLASSAVVNQPLIKTCCQRMPVH